MNPGYQEQPNKKSKLQLIKNSINETPKVIEGVFGRGEHTWMECFGDSVLGIHFKLIDEDLKSEFDEEKYKEVLNRIEILKKRVEVLKEQFPNKANLPPEEIRDDLLEKLEKLID